MSEIERSLIERCIEEVRQPGYTVFDLSAVTRLLADRLGDRQRAERMVDTWDRAMEQVSPNWAMIRQLMALWEMPTFADCESMHEVMIRRRERMN
jgi:hypothetical protein